MLVHIGYKDIFFFQFPDYLYSQSVHQFLRLTEKKEQNQEASSLCLPQKRTVFYHFIFGCNRQRASAIKLNEHYFVIPEFCS